MRCPTVFGCLLDFHVVSLLVCAFWLAPLSRCCLPGWMNESGSAACWSTDVLAQVYMNGPILMSAGSSLQPYSTARLIRCVASAPFFFFSCSFFSCLFAFLFGPLPDSQPPSLVFFLLARFHCHTRLFLFLFPDLVLCFSFPVFSA